MRLLGIDYGDKRVGLALTDESGHFAMPYKVVANTPQLLETVAEICQDSKVAAIVLGESKNWQGKANPIMKRVEAFKTKLAEATGLPIVFEPEFLTSVEAGRLPAGGSGKIKTESLDASAAALILKSYIDKQAKNGNK